jgi:MoxR-like ATPase
VGKSLNRPERAGESALTGMIAGGHLLVEGIPGLGTDPLGPVPGQAIGGESARVQFMPTSCPATSRAT